jgi:hypothetical protein
LLASGFQQNLHLYNIAASTTNSFSCQHLQHYRRLILSLALSCHTPSSASMVCSSPCLAHHRHAGGRKDLLKSIIGRKCDRNDVHPIDESAWRHCESSVWHDGIGLALFHSEILSDPFAQFAVVFLPWFMTWITRACWILNWQGMGQTCSHRQLQAHCRAKFTCRGMGIAQEPRFADCERAF